MDIEKIKKSNFFKELTDLPYITKIILYGSRSKKSQQKRSDIDLAINCPDAIDIEWLEIKEILERADTLLKIDCIRLDELTPKSRFKKAILEEGIVLFERNSLLTSRIKQNFEQLNKALNSLEITINLPVDRNRVVIDATIQRFEFTFELFWKLLKRIIQDLGKEVYLPKEILIEAYSAHLIDHEQSWLQMLKDRNETSHVYDEKLANRIYANIKKHFPVMKETFNKLSDKFLKEKIK